MSGAAFTSKSESSNKISSMIEKEVVSQIANVGIYGFKSIKIFKEFAAFIINNGIKVKNEFYISSVFSLYFKNNLNVISKFIKDVHIIGTPIELNFFVKHVLQTMKPKSIGFVSDHSGFKFKDALINLFNKNEYQTVNYGCFSSSDCDYSDFVPTACNGVINKEVDLVIGACMSGQGVNISANHQSGIISILPYNEETLIAARKHNCPNFISFPSSIWDPEQAYKILKRVYEDIHFQGGRHSIRIQKALA